MMIIKIIMTLFITLNAMHFCEGRGLPKELNCMVNSLNIYDDKTLFSGKTSLGSTLVGFNFAEHYCEFTIRGTANIGDFFVDVDYLPRTINDIYGHQGILIKAKQLVDFIKTRRECDGKSIIFCGHSLGGAIASASAIMHNNITTRSYSFAEPRFLSVESFLSVNTDSKLYVIGFDNDPVFNNPSFYHHPRFSKMKIIKNLLGFNVPINIIEKLESQSVGKLYYQLTNFDKEKAEVQNELLKLILPHSMKTYCVFYYVLLKAGCVKLSSSPSQLLRGCHLNHLEVGVQKSENSNDFISWRYWISKSEEVNICKLFSIDTDFFN